MTLALRTRTGAESAADERRVGLLTRVSTERQAMTEEGSLKNQLQRLRELVLQREGTFAVTSPEVARELKIMDEQRQQFMTVIQELQKKVEPLMKEMQSGGDPTKIAPKIHEYRRQHATRLEALLTETQRDQWKKMLGKPFAWDE